MSLKTQAKVLRVLQEQVMERGRQHATVRVDVRVVAATNKDLPGAIQGGQFREDLYFRLNVIPIFVPPLRARQDDIPLLADHFMSGFAREYGRRPKTLSPEAVMELQRYPWPGNVRELRNVIERLMIMVPGDTIGDADLAFLNRDVVTPHVPAATGGDVLPLHDARERFEQQYILRVLAAQQGNMSRTAEVLGVERSNLYRKMRAFGIAPARRGDADEDAGVDEDDSRTSVRRIRRRSNDATRLHMRPGRAQPVLEHLVARESVELQVPLGRGHQRRGRHEPDDLALEHASRRSAPPRA